MTKFNTEREVDITKATNYYNQHPDMKKSKVAAKFPVSYHWFKSQLIGWPAQNSNGGDNKALNFNQKGLL